MRYVSMLGKLRFWRFRFLLFLFVLVALDSTQLYGQSSTAFTATLSGSIVDPAGGTVSGAKVTLTSPAIGFSRTYLTKETGLYTFTFLPPAVYILEVEAKGFKHYKQEGITLAAGQAPEQNVSLVVGAVTETIEISFSGATCQCGKCQRFGRPIR